MSCQDVHTDHMEERTRVVEVSNPGQVEYSIGHKKVPNTIIPVVKQAKFCHSFMHTLKFCLAVLFVTCGAQKWSCHLLRIVTLCYRCTMLDVNVFKFQP